MQTPRVLVSLTTNSNDYQQLQAVDAEETAKRLGIDLRVVFANNDAVEQSTQLLQAIQADVSNRPNAIIVEPVGTGMPQVARSAVSTGIAWAVLNREEQYIGELRRSSVPVFAVVSDHEEIGRIQGMQMAALLPQGGTVLLVEGPSAGDIARKRKKGTLAHKPANVQLTTVKGNWTADSAYQAVAGWLALSTARRMSVSLIAGQDDSMAMGARRAIQERLPAEEAARWLRHPFIGCDGLPLTGQAWVKQGILAATIEIPSNAGAALKIMVHSLRTRCQPSECTKTVPISYPALNDLCPRS